MSNLIIVIILLIILIPASRATIKHMYGEGSCCGGPKEKVPKKKIVGKKLGQYLVTVEGMHCDNCKNRIERSLNALDGVVSKVNRAKKTAVVSYYRPIDTARIKSVIEELGFTVTQITEK